MNKRAEVGLLKTRSAVIRGWLRVRDEALCDTQGLFEIRKVLGL
jgi:hypothetical protein